MRLSLCRIPARSLNFAGWIAVWLLLPAWACYVQNPHLLPLRPWGVQILVMLCLALMLRARHLAGAARVLWLLPLLVATLVAVTGETQFHFAKRQVLGGAMPPAQVRALAAHFIVGYRDFEALRPLVAQGLVDGVFITRRNIADRSAAQIRDRITLLQTLRRDAGLPPLIIATDQEGGPVSRLSPPLPFEPPLASLLSAGSADLDARAEAYGLRQGQGLASLGVTVDFSPVVDLKDQHGPALLDTHTQIGSRAIAEDPAMVSRVALAYGRGLARAGVAPTLKHFPGLGQVRGDTHHFSVALNTPLATLQAREWLPFRSAAQPLDALIMLGHVTLPEIDAEMPASLSRKVVQGVIRDTWHHEGVLITDDLSMQAAYGHGLCKAVTSALNAGVDLLLISYDDEQIYPALACAARALEKGELDRAMLERSGARLQAWRKHWLAASRDALPNQDRALFMAQR
jgi:beta-N-acetylhexosaminidase